MLFHSLQNVWMMPKTWKSRTSHCDSKTHILCYVMTWLQSCFPSILRVSEYKDYPVIQFYPTEDPPPAHTITIDCTFPSPVSLHALQDSFCLSAYSQLKYVAIRHHSGEWCRLYIQHYSWQLLCEIWHKVRPKIGRTDSVRLKTQAGVWVFVYENKMSSHTWLPNTMDNSSLWRVIALFYEGIYLVWTD